MMTGITWQWSLPGHPGSWPGPSSWGLCLPVSPQLGQSARVWAEAPETWSLGVWWPSSACPSRGEVACVGRQLPVPQGPRKPPPRAQAGRPQPRGRAAWSQEPMGAAPKGGICTSLSVVVHGTPADDGVQRQGRFSGSRGRRPH